MPFIRLRYPLLMITGIIIFLSLYHQQDDSTVSLLPPPRLDPGYYIVLHTDAKLPKDIPTKGDQHRTYIGPFPHIKACHENRVKVKPLYPGVETELLKINDQSS